MANLSYKDFLATKKTTTPIKSVTPTKTGDLSYDSFLKSKSTTPIITQPIKTTPTPTPTVIEPKKNIFQKYAEWSNGIGSKIAEAETSIWNSIVAKNNSMLEQQNQKKKDEQYLESVKNKEMQTVTYTDPKTGKIATKQLPKATIGADTRSTRQDVELRLNELTNKSAKIEKEKKIIDALKVDETDPKSVADYNNKIKLYNNELTNIKTEYETLNSQIEKGLIPEGPTARDQIKAQQDYLENKAMRSDIGLIKKANLFLDKSSYEIERDISNVAIGGIQSTKSMVEGLQWMSDAAFSKATGEPIKGENFLAKKMNNWSLAIEDSAGITDYNKNFADSLLQGVGSAASFFLPGFGIMKGAGFFGKVSPRLASWFANSVPTALEATAEAGSVYEEVYAKTGDRNKAGSAATKTFLANIILIFLTNKAGGVFENYSTGMIKKALIAAPSEGLQEYGQQIISNYSADKPLTEGANESAFIGALLGFAMGLIGSPVVRERYSEDEKKLDNIISNVIDKTEAIKNEKSKDFKNTKTGKVIDSVSNLRQEVTDSINTVGPEETYSMLKNEAGMDSKTARKVIENVMNQNAVEQTKQTPTLDIEQASKQALNESGSTLEETKTPEADNTTPGAVQPKGATDTHIRVGAEGNTTIQGNEVTKDNTKVSYKVIDTLGGGQQPITTIKKTLIDNGVSEVDAESIISKTPVVEGMTYTDNVFDAITEHNNGVKSISEAQGEAKMKISGETKKVTDQMDDYIKDNIQKVTDLAYDYKSSNGKPDFEAIGMAESLIKSTKKTSPLSSEERLTYNELVKRIKQEDYLPSNALDTLKTKEDNIKYGENKTTTNGEVQNNIRDLRQGDDRSQSTYSLENRSKDRDIRSLGGQNESGKRVENSRIPQGKSRGEVRRIVESVFPEAQPEVIDEIIISNTLLNNIGIELEIQRSDTLNGRTDFDAGIQNGQRTSLLTLNNKHIAEIKKDSIWHEVFGHKWYQNLTDQQKELHFNKIKEQYNLDKKLFDKFLAKEYWESFIDLSIKNDITNANPGILVEEIDKILINNGFLTENNEVITPENVLDTVFNFTPMSDKLNKYLRENGYNPSIGVLEYNNLMGEEINSYIAENAEIFKDSSIKEIKEYSGSIINNTLEFNKGSNLEFGGQRFKLKETTKLTSADIIKKHANIQLKRDIVITDVYGEKATLKAGEGITPYEVTGNKFILQDGEAYLVSKSQAQNVINNSKTGEAKPFAPELKQTEETIKGGKPKITDADIIWKQTSKIGEPKVLNGTYGDRKFVIQDEGDGFYVAEVDGVLGRKARNYTDAVEELNRYLAKEGEVTRYSQYTLPGGENYKEILIKAQDKWDLRENGTEKVVKTFDTYKEAQDAMMGDSKKYHIIPTNGKFKSSHWDEPNVISHIRMNERTYNGKKVAFMEELQSDWAREGRDKGFSKEITKETAKEQGFTVEKSKSTTGDEAYFIDNTTDEFFYRKGFPNTGFDTEAEAWDSVIKKLKETTGAVPNNPLLKNWQELSIKRALQEAVNSNAKYFAWINGPQTAARYNLSKEIENIGWKPFNDGKILDIKPKDGKIIELVIDKSGKINPDIKSNNRPDNWDNKQLDEVIGKGIAEKIMASPKGKLEGEGLNMGGEWATNLYDRQVRVIVENLTGQKVEMLDMGLEIGSTKDERFLQDNGSELYVEGLRIGKHITKVSDKSEWRVTNVDGNNFKVVPEKVWVKAEEYTTTKKRSMPSFEMENVAGFEDAKLNFSIKQNKSTGQMGIELTPEVKQIIKGEAPQVKVSGKLPFAEQITAPVMFKLKQPISIPVNEKLKDATIKEIFNERRDQITPTTGEYQFKTKDEVLTFINKNKGKKFMSSVINAPFEVNEITKQHLYDKYRPQSDYERKTKLFGPGLEIAESKGILVGIDAITDKAIGITYYDIIGIDPNMPNIIIKVKLSEENKNGKAYFTVSEISGGAPVPATPSSGRRLGRLTTSESITESIPPSEKKSQVGDVKFKIKLPEVNTGNKVEDTKQILKFVEKKLGVSSVVNSLQEKKALIEVAKESLNESPMKELEPYVADSGVYKGELPEVTGNKLEEIKKNKDFKGVKNQKALEFAQKGDVIVEGINMEYGINLDSEDARLEFEKYQKQKENIAKREIEVKKQVELFGKTDTFKIVGQDKTLIGEITATRAMPEKIMEIMDQVKKEKKSRREEVLNHPARPLMKYIDKKTKKLPKIGSKTAFGQEGTQILKDLKFNDITEANKAIADYISKRDEFVNPISRLRLQERNAKFLRDKQKIMEEVEKKIRAEARDRKSKIEAIRDYFYITDSEMKEAIGEKDYRLVSDKEFEKLLTDVEEKALKIAEHAVAVSEVEWTIAQKELHRVENLQQAMELPIDLKKMTTDQLNKLNQVLGIYETGDVFLGVREIETLAKNAGLPDVKTQRQVLEEVIGKRTDVPIEEIMKITSSWFDKFRSAISLSRQNPFYEILVSDAYSLKLEASARYLEIEKKVNELVKKARDSRYKTLKQRLSPTDDMVIAYLEEGDLETRNLIAKDMSKAELELAHYIKQQYAEMRDFLVQREQLDRVRENYYTHRPRGFLEAWLRGGATKTPSQFVKAFFSAFKETVLDIHKLDEATFKILDEQTSEILPLEKFFKYSMRRSGQLIQTKNLANAFLGYKQTFEMKRGLDKYIPRMEAVARALTPTETTEGGLTKDTSLERFVKEWINTQKGRPKSLGIVNPGDTLDSIIRSGVAFTRFLDLALRVPAQFMSLVGEEGMTWINIGSKRYAMGQYRAKTKRGNQLVKQYEEIIGKSFWDKMSEQANSIGNKIGETVYAFYGIAARNANIHHFLGSLTKEEFESGKISEKRLTEIKMEMTKWRADDMLSSVIGKTSIGAMFSQHKSWAIPILNQTLSNLDDMKTMVASGEYKNAVKSKQFGELFRATMLTLLLVLTISKWYRDLYDKKDRNFAEELAYRAMNDAFSFISALSPTTLFTQPRLMLWIGDMSKAITTLSQSLATGERTSAGKVQGTKEIIKAFTPKLFSEMLKADEQDKIMTSISTSTIKAQKELDIINKEIVDPAQTAWDEVKKLGVGTEEADTEVSKLSDDEYEAYKLAKKADTDYWTLLAEQVTPITEEAYKVGFGTEEANKLIEDLSDDEYEMYKKVKTALYGKPDEQGPSDWDQQSFVTHVTNLSRGWLTDPVTAFDNLIHGDWKITKLKNGQIIVNRMPMDASQKVKEEAAKNNKNYKLDHSIPLEVGGTNREENLNIITTEDWSENTPVENYLGKALLNGNIDGDQAREYIIRYKIGKGQILSEKLMKEYTEKYNEVPISFQQIKETIGQR